MDEIIDALIDLLESGEDVSDEILQEVLSIIQEGQPTEAPVTPGADLLWILSGENPQAFTQYLKNFPDPALNALANNPTQLQATINQLAQQITTPVGESEDGIAKAPLQSSNIYGFRYDPRTSTLKVRFNCGSVYSYDGVPPNVFKMFQSAAIPARTDGQNQYGKWWKGKSPSAGATFYALIRDRFPYKRLR